MSSLISYVCVLCCNLESLNNITIKLVMKQLSNDIKHYFQFKLIIQIYNISTSFGVRFFEQLIVMICRI